jgi:hypothetical protein
MHSFEEKPENEQDYYTSVMKRLESQQTSHLFSNSYIAPAFRKNCVCDADGVDYWRDHTAAITYDCCSLHRSLKQTQLEAEALSERSLSLTRVRTHMQYQQRTQEQIRSKAVLPISEKRPNGNHPRQFMTGDAASLCFQLALIEERLKRMKLRKELQALEEAHPRSVAPLRTTPPSYGPIDIWYELAEDTHTPPIMLTWLTQHRNPYIATRANKTLSHLKESA